MFLIFIASFLFAKELIFYCGITMAKPMAEIAQKFEKKYNIKVKIIPGGSKTLLETIKKSKKADLYLPGSEGYILKNKELFKDYIYIGYNKLALIVKKDNPHNIKSLKDLDKNYKIAMCNYKFSSCGKESKKVLKDKFWRIYDKAVVIVLDSAPLNKMVKNDVDVGLNWRATINFDNNSKFLKAIDIKEAKKHKLYLAIVKYTKNYKDAKKFLEFTKQNLEILKRYGFED